MNNRLSSSEKKILLHAARQAIEQAVTDGIFQPIDLQTFPTNLCQTGSSFVTLTKYGDLRGCIGSLDFKLPLIEDVRQHAVAAALHDYRFPPVLPGELKIIRIEISHLCLPQTLNYQSSDELVKRLRPDIDGVVLRQGTLQATFLPQVWKKIPNPEDFLSHLCLKMGTPANSWRTNQPEVLIYQVDEFHESG